MIRLYRDPTGASLSKGRSVMFTGTLSFENPLGGNLMQEVGILRRRVKELESLLNQTHHSSPTGHQNELQVDSVARVVSDQCLMQQQGGPKANGESQFTKEVCFIGKDPTSADVEPSEMTSCGERETVYTGHPAF